jgi:phage terminase small subunit
LIVTNPLPSKQRQFAVEYLKDLNGTKAYLRAGYKVSEKVAGVNACRLLGDARIQKLIREGMARRAERCQVSQDEVVVQLKTIAFCADERTRDQLKALELLGRHLGMFTDRVDATVDVKDSLAEHLVKARERVRNMGTE